MGITRGGAATFLFVVLSIGATAVWADDVDDGWAAFQKGDYATALKLLMPMAQKGNAVAELDIGIMYFGGKGLPQDRREAAKWFKASAEQGVLGAQNNLGIAYATGDGVPRNLVLAYMWFSLAADQGGTISAKYRDHVATELTPEELKSAQSLAAQCKDSKYQNCAPQDRP
jgi:hypothetical protein